VSSRLETRRPLGSAPEWLPLLISVAKDYRAGMSPSATGPDLATPPEDAPGPGAVDAGEPLAVELRMVLLRSARRLRALKSDDELSDSQFSVLARLDVLGPLTPGELADHEHVRPPSMTRTLGVLVEGGLVARTDHPDDGRQVLVCLTAGGRQTVEENRRRRAAWLSDRLAGLTPAERTVLAEAAEVLRKVIA
jgi:DNA-binding MarR family transcriptional regulator